MSAKAKHPFHSTPRKILLIVTLVLACFAVALEYQSLFGGWLDKALSRYFSKELNRPVSLVAVKVEQLDSLRFGAFTVGSQDGRTLMAANQGRMDLYGYLSRSDRPRSIIFSFKDAAILEDFYKKLPIISWISKYIFSDPIYLEEMKFVMTQSPAGTSLRILKFYSDEIWVMGGVRFKDKTLLRANLLIAVPNATYEKLPKEVRSRMMRRKEGWRAVRITYGGGVFTVEGAMGPFFKATWS